MTECKAEWPGPDKARQLAGMANQAAGEPIVWIIGFDEGSGQVVNPGETDPADWWAGMEKEFDEVAPDQLRQLKVYLTDSEYVHAIAFDTQRAPYVVKMPHGRDVPMRTTTRTRSANRHELMRLLLPSINTPQISLLDADLFGRWRAERPPEKEPGRAARPGAPATAYVMGNAYCFVEHIGPGVVMMPTHRMQGRYRIGDWEGALSVKPRLNSEERPVSVHGIEVRHEGLVVSGSGAFGLELVGDVPFNRVDELDAVANVHIDLEVEAVGARRPVRLSGELQRHQASAALGGDAEFWRHLGSFRLPAASAVD